jgi:hypothetical protein
MGIESQKRTDTPTSAGAEMSFVMGGPRPQITTTIAITAVATPGAGSPSVAAGAAAVPAAGAPVLTGSTVAPRRGRAW